MYLPLKFPLSRVGRSYRRAKYESCYSHISPQNSHKFFELNNNMGLGKLQQFTRNSTMQRPCNSARVIKYIIFVNN